SKLLASSTILSMAHLGERAFDTIGGAIVSTTAFVIQNAHYTSNKKGDYLRLIEGNSEAEKKALIKEAIFNPASGLLYRISTEDFGRIPGSPITYWISRKIFSTFDTGVLLKDIACPRVGLQTNDNPRFIRD